MTINIVILLFLLLQIKHFLVDFPLQTPFQWMNKGTYAHWGGNLHAGLHAVATMAIFAVFIDWNFAFWLGALDFALHYHIDWAKMNINKKMGWKADTHAQFWVLLGLDQLLHQLTYIGLVWAAVTLVTT